VSAVRTIRMTDGSTRKFYCLRVKSSVLQEKRNRAKKLLRQVLRENREAEQKQEKRRKRELRAVLALFGKS
jgi:hypothetical protein